MEQIANLSTGNCLQGSIPCLSTTKTNALSVGLFLFNDFDREERCLG